MKNLVWLLIFLFIISCNNDEFSETELLFRISDSNYPTGFNKLTQQQQKQKQAEFEKGQVTFSEIDSFGFVGWSFNDDFEIRKALYKTQFSDAAELTTLVKLYMVEKGAFTGITDTSMLIPKEIKLRFQNYGGEFTQTDSTKYNHLGIDFGTQKINGLEVYNSLLTISASANGVHHVFGHWYTRAYIPPGDKVSVDLAKKVLTGKKLKSYNGWGQELNHIISLMDLDDYRKIIYPYINGNRLELRVCWEFTPSHWQIFMDTSTGEILLEQDTMGYYLH